ncbi:NAD-dependent epimerase [Olivibacter ginsenosidimutans]|uniref:NAD-dependent epimerase n=1 Tax=Olivibacter ginsenosidimutans TaxID=1176537 RepID=A0ABP9ATI9_9SPHI
MAHKYLVTGAAGFIGSFVVNYLLNRGDYVVGIDNINDYYDVRLKYARLQQAGIEKSKIEWHKKAQSSTYSNYEFIRMNLEDKDELNELCKDNSFDAIINLAAQAGVRYSIENPDAYVQSNVVGFLNILEVCRAFHVKHLVYASSSSVYGMNESMPFSVKQNVDHPVSLYAATKKSNELMAHAYSHLYKIPTSSLRFFTVYGPWGRPDMAYYLFAEAIREDRPIKVFNHGRLKRDFTYIDDIVNGIINVLDNPAQPNVEWNGKFPDPSSSTAPFRVYNIGNNEPIELMEFIETIGEAMGKKPKMIMMDMQPGDVLATWADIDDLINNFNYKPKTSIKEGISLFTEWYKAYARP